MRKFSRRHFDFFLFYLLFHLISKEDASYGDLLALFFLAPIYHLEAFDSQAKAVLVGCIYNQASLSPSPPVIKQLCWHQRKMHHLASSRPSDMNRWTFTQLLNFASPSQPLPRGSSKDKMPFNKWFCTSLKWWIVRQTSWKCPDCMKWWDLEQESQKFPGWQNIV